MAEEWEETKEDWSTIKIPLEFRNLNVRQDSKSVRDLWSRVISGNIILEPDFQRHYIWPPWVASRFIESLILRIPVPPIFIAEEADGKWVVVDGHQRLQTIARFFQPILISTGTISPEDLRKLGLGKEQRGITYFTPLTLKGMKFLDELEGKNAQEIQEMEGGGKALEELWDQKIGTIEILKDSNSKLKFEFFARLNQGSMALNPQELRNCLYRGNYSKLTKDLGEDNRTLKVFGRKFPDKRMKERELVLSFFALAHMLHFYRAPFQMFLNDEMEANQSANDDLLEIFRHEFWNSLDWVEKVFKENAFRLFVRGNEDNPNGYWSRRMSLIYEAEMVGFHQFSDQLNHLCNGLDKKDGKSFLLGLRHKLITLMTQQNFLTTLHERTKMEYVVRRRFDLWGETLQKALTNWKKTIEEANKITSLLQIGTICSICSGNMSFEDAKLIEDNKLAHRAHQD